MFRPIVGVRYRVTNPAEEESLERHEGKAVKTVKRVMIEGTEATDYWECKRIDTGESLNLYDDELESI